jgi:hypothetical protein
MDNDILIFYLTNNDRYFVFERFINELKMIKKINNIYLLIVNSTSDSIKYDKFISNTPIKYECITVESTKCNYLPKVATAIQYAKSNNFKYIMKCDNDIIIPTYTFDYIMDNLELLDNNLTISPTLSTGIPSVEYFIDSFLSKEEALIVRNEFKKCIFFDQPGIFDYRQLNSFMDCMNETNSWNYNAYFKTLQKCSNSLIQYDNTGRTFSGHNKYYMGMHPIRHGFGNQEINNYIIKYRNKFFMKKECSFTDRSFPYLCDMCFCISTYNYDRLINFDNLIIDGCDEVPLNRYASNNNLKHLIVDNGYAIHITYNWRWFLNNIDGGSNIEKPTEDILLYEEKFINNLYK